MDSITSRFFISIIIILHSYALSNAQQDSLPANEIRIDTVTGYGKSQLGEYNEAYFKVKKMNSGLPPKPEIINLQTPQSAMEHYIMSSQRGDFRSAAFTLNFNQLPDDVDHETAEILARKLYYLLYKRIKVDWDILPDRPDGQINQSSGKTKSVAGEPRRSIRIGMISLTDWDVPIRMERYKSDNSPPVWMFSANTVQNIEMLYDEHGPGWLERVMPNWLQFEIFGLVFWKFVGVIVLAIACFLAGKYSRHVLKKITLKSDNNWIAGIGDQIATPVAITISVLIYYILLNDVLSLTGSIAPFVYALLLVILIGCVTWLILKVIDYAMDRVQDKQVGDISDEENLESRRLLTNISVGRRVFTFILIIVGLGIVMSQFPSLQSIGISLMASAGIATVILGIAAQSTLGNVIAGMNIALTKPVNIGDAVIFEDEYGVIEDIKFTYLLIKTWDERRVVVPLQYFITNPFENWSKSNPHMLKPISLFVDFEFDVDGLREKFEHLLKESDNYDEEHPPLVQVVGSDKDALEVRALCSAKDASTAWDLHCKLREDLMKFVASNGMTDQLPKERVEIVKDESK